MKAPPGMVAVIIPEKTIARLDELIDKAQVPPNHDDQAAHDVAETMRVMLYENRSKGWLPKRVVKLQ